MKQHFLVSPTDNADRQLQYYLKSAAQMEAHFADRPEVLENAERIASLCQVELTLGETYLPDFDPPEGQSQSEYLRELAARGLAARLRQARDRGLEPDETVYRERLAVELDTIENMKYPGYFLIVADFIAAA